MSAIEQIALDFAGALVGEYIEAISLFVSVSGDTDLEVRRELLLKVRETELAKVDAIERQLGITPRTSQIRAWHKESQMR